MNNLDEELEANQFAMELLMPESFIRDEIAKLPKFDINDDGAMERLAKKFKVSVAMMGMRLMQIATKKHNE